MNKRRWPFVTSMVAVIGLCAIASSYCIVINDTSKRRKESSNLNAQIEDCNRKTRLRRDIERTLSVSYEFLSKYEVRSYADMFCHFSDETGIPWEMFAAIVRIESNFDPTQKSDKGAIGMTQVLESTGKATANRMGVRFKDGTTLWNDVINMAIGFTYFAEGYQQHLIECSDTVEALHFAICRYLAGTAAASSMVKKSKSSSGGMEVRQYVSEYNETIWQEYRKLHFTFKGVCAE